MTSGSRIGTSPRAAPQGACSSAPRTNRESEVVAGSIIAPVLAGFPGGVKLLELFLNIQLTQSQTAICEATHDLKLASKLKLWVGSRLETTIQPGEARG
jgi:hypothetical protein